MFSARPGVPDRSTKPSPSVSETKPTSSYTDTVRHLLANPNPPVPKIDRSLKARMILKTQACSNNSQNHHQFTQFFDGLLRLQYQISEHTGSSFLLKYVCNSFELSTPVQSKPRLRKRRTWVRSSMPKVTWSKSPLTWRRKRKSLKTGGPFSG